MFDTMTMTKAVAGVCGALLVFLLGSWAATSIYAMGGGHGEEHSQAYTIEVEGGSSEPVEEAAPVDVALLMATADLAAGEKAFGKCKACHKLDGSNGTGPHLNGVVDRAKSSVEGFSFSAAAAERSAESWTPQNIYGFIENPKGYMPGTKMSFGGLPKSEDRVNLIAYLATQK